MSGRTTADAHLDRRRLAHGRAERLENRGRAHEREGSLPDAIACYRRMRAVLHSLLGRDPSDDRTRDYAVGAARRLARAMLRLENVPDAHAFADEAVALAEGSARPGTAGWRRQHELTCELRAAILEKEGKDAERLWREGLRIARALARELETTRSLLDWAISLETCAARYAEPRPRRASALARRQAEVARRVLRFAPPEGEAQARDLVARAESLRSRLDDVLGTSE